MTKEEVLKKVYGDDIPEGAEKLLDWVRNNPGWWYNPTSYGDSIVQALDSALIQLYGKPIEEYTKKSNRTRDVMMRQIIALVLRSKGLYLVDIARLLNRNHSTISYAINAAEFRVENENMYRKTFNEINEKFTMYL